MLNNYRIQLKKKSAASCAEPRLAKCNAEYLLIKV